MSSLLTLETTDPAPGSDPSCLGRSSPGSLCWVPLSCWLLTGESPSSPAPGLMQNRALRIPGPLSYTRGGWGWGG